MVAGTFGPGGHLAVHHAGWDFNKEDACATTLNQRLGAITASAIIPPIGCALKCIAIVSVLCIICLVFKYLFSNRLGNRQVVIDNWSYHEQTSGLNNMLHQFVFIINSRMDVVVRLGRLLFHMRHRDSTPNAFLSECTSIVPEQQLFWGKLWVSNLCWN